MTMRRARMANGKERCWVCSGPVKRHPVTEGFAALGTLVPPRLLRAFTAGEELVLRVFPGAVIVPDEELERETDDEGPVPGWWREEF